jgi:arylsulfatase
LLLGAISLPAANEQQTTGVQGAPDATTTIDSRYLPPLPQKFDGQINLNAAQSKPAWLARVVPPKGAPNILLSLADDVGFDEPPTFGDVKAVPKLAPDDVKKFEAANRDAQ